MRPINRSVLFQLTLYHIEQFISETIGHTGAKWFISIVKRTLGYLLHRYSSMLFPYRFRNFRADSWSEILCNLKFTNVCGSVRCFYVIINRDRFTESIRLRWFWELKLCFITRLINVLNFFFFLSTANRTAINNNRSGDADRVPNEWYMNLIFILSIRSGTYILFYFFSVTHKNHCYVTILPFILDSITPLT